MKYLVLVVAFLLGAMCSGSADAQGVSKKGLGITIPKGCEQRGSSSWSQHGLPKLTVVVVSCDDPYVMWIVARRSTSSGYETAESTHFRGGDFGFNGIEINDVNNFNVALLDSRSMTMPVNFEYQFSWRHRAWVLLSSYFDWTQNCGGSFGDGSKVTINYISGKVRVDEYEKCEPHKSYNTMQKPQVVSLEKFAPLDPPVYP
ncbi:MAG: hypothetical protein EPN68_03715 [Rhodanobacter sp.]|nr:MAG: hypothetical protein EPN68_03715 [Rhodanobacter sp.]